MSNFLVSAVTKAQLVMEAVIAKLKLDVAAGELAGDILALDSGKADKPAPVSFILPASGWTAEMEVAGYNYRCDVAAENVTANHFVRAILAPGSQAAAAGCGLCPTIAAHEVDGAGKIRFWAASMPESAITGTYYAQERAEPEEGETAEMAYGFVSVGGGSSGVADAIVSRLGLYLDGENELAQADDNNENEGNEGE